MSEKYWLMKTEPDVFSIDDLKKVKIEHWDGVRNYQARNFMRDEMKNGDVVLIYHSNCTPPGIAGLATVDKEAYPDHTSWDKKSKYYDPKSNPDNPRWYMVDVRFKEKFDKFVDLPVLKTNPVLKDMKILQKGSRLSITPVTVTEFNEILHMAQL
ncbi:MAG: EVE domain-containing protein [Halobacteriovoraceae bacterium]|nr:EVE domain-containing protein [Halobacteriovoraceae bacterium]